MGEATESGQGLSDEAEAVLLEGIGVITALIGGEGDSAGPRARNVWTAWEARVRGGAASPLGWLVERFDLSSFELRVVMLGVALEVEPRMASLLAHMPEQPPGLRAASVRVALQRLAEDPMMRLVSRRAFLPSGALVRSGIIALEMPREGAPAGLLDRAFALSAPALRVILGEAELPLSPATRVEAELRDALLNVAIDPIHIEAVRRLTAEVDGYRAARAAWQLDADVPWPRGLTINLHGPAGTGKSLFVRALAGYLGRPLVTCSAHALPAGATARAAIDEAFLDARLRDGVVVVDGCEALAGTVLAPLIDGFDGVCLLVSHAPIADPDLDARIVCRVPFTRPDAERRHQMWELHLGPGVPLAGDVDIEVLASRYELTGAGIKNAVTHAIAHALTRGGPAASVALSMADLDAGCKAQLPAAVDGLLVTSGTRHRLNDIVLPAERARQVGEVIAACKNQSTVLSRWGFGRRLATGKGITVLFDGPPGTGKTYCAEIIAGELGRPLYRVNIADVVSKWIGETEKHIRAVFREARASQGVLLFDEADSLLAARTAEAKSSSDKYANMSVNQLLQEIERFEGVAILTTNLFRGLDDAVIRRIQFRITLEAPAVAERERIWRVLCPASAPLAANVDFVNLAQRFEMTGAQIKNALVRAAYRACEAGAAIDQATLDRACKDECVAAGRLMREAA